MNDSDLPFQPYY